MHYNGNNQSSDRNFYFTSKGELCVSVWPVLPQSGKADLEAEPFLQCAYPSISATGRPKNSPRIVTFIVRRTKSATNVVTYTAHVFVCLCMEEAFRLNRSLSKASKQAHWVM